jgi:hypothetical protein
VHTRLAEELARTGEVAAAVTVAQRVRRSEQQVSYPLLGALAYGLAFVTVCVKGVLSERTDQIGQCVQRAPLKIL